MKLSILMPVYNEKEWVGEIVRKVLQQEVEGISEKELIIVDDGSTDGTAAIIQSLGEMFPQEIIVACHEENKGKGAAIRTAINKATGDIILVQDADFEYDPAEYGRLLNPILKNRADVVFGTRFGGSSEHRVLYFWHMMGNKFLTFLSNMFTNLNLTDMETCYKVFRKEILDQITLRENRFGLEPEITAKVAKLQCRIYEVGVSYYGRTYVQGKKINWKDGVWALVCIFKYNVFCFQVKK
ncbi:MAG: glycosyltransferase family 2 protein [Candidatus Omnitrophica bacterium]|nr:glycosyltransferase family 2 protein [Candidatus Omnitrophota bacterium]